MPEPTPLPGSNITPPPPPPHGIDNLQLDKVQYSNASNSLTCAACNSSIRTEYYESNGKIVCPVCKQTLAGLATNGSGMGRFIKALLFGLIATVISAIAYFAIVKITNYELAIATIAMGWVIGKAVFAGTGHRGGWLYMTLAALLTYFAIGVSATVIGLTTEPMESAPEFSLLYIVGVVTIALIMPVMVAMEAPILFLIYGFGIYQAVRMNLRTQITVSGPYQLANNQAGAGYPTVSLPENR